MSLEVPLSVMQIVLASSSSYRRALLARLCLRFEVIPPELDESARPGEDASTLAARLAEAKARVVASMCPNSLVIGSDQVALRAGEILGKPGTPAANVEQLRASSGQVVEFLTGLSLVNSVNGRVQTEVVRYAVKFLELTETQIHAYVAAEPAHDCAGGFRGEGLGVALFERVQGEDPTALIGLPLVRLCAMLRREGLDPLLRRAQTTDSEFGSERMHQ